ncbi:hypothetical protein CKM354_001278000 [Cercospora kikuchii]|uniref:NADP-dependent oxidoreductase domain-containing protein n=1 Tax=Cercospora kikuchii TaxID=84275 RepID=A0A9P3L290_9PEZI|nr:uncharacterized protein CKM354_001278000 [Cercospora kikuchii]GIZ49753.1 hypothetical protein CKM354_001278000 [Cercospora kikuchii]
MPLSSSFQLNTGTSIPSVGFGTFQAPPAEVEVAVQTALKAGYRHLDCASIYGNEDAVGRGLKASGIPREDVFITSKLWNNKHHPDDVEAALDQTLRDLGTSHVDLYLVHWPVVFKSGENPMPLDADGLFVLGNIPLSETWTAMERLLATGKTRAIGVSNFSIRLLEDLLSKSKVVPAVNQIEAHPYLQQPDLLKYCKQNGILVQAYSPLGNNETNSPRCIDDPRVQALAKKAGLDVGQLLVSWAVQRGTVVLPKSVTKSRIESNFKVTELSPEIFDAVTSLEKHHRYNFPARWGWNVFDELEEADVKRLARENGASNLALFAAA